MPSRTPNPNRKKTVRARVPLIGGLAAMAASMGGLLDARMGFRLAIIMAGMVLAGERRVAAAWFVAGGVQDDWDRLYGHNWVSLAMVVKHSLWGVIALPLRSMLYVRAANRPKWTEKYGWQFRTKHELPIDLVAWFVETARGMGLRCAIWLAVDSAYAARPFLRAMGRWSVVVVSRLRKAMSGKQIQSLMRRCQMTIGELSKRMQITQKRIREVRERGLTDPNVVRDWVQGITGSDPGPIAGGTTTVARFFPQRSARR